MEKLKKKRTTTRSIFTKVIKTLESILKEDVEDGTELKAQFKFLESKNEELKLLDQEIYDLFLETDCSEEDLENEMIKSYEYTTSFNKMEIKVSKINVLMSTELNSNCSQKINTASNHSQVLQRKFKLPFLELKKFDGNLINWLQFWAQFSKIHNDTDIASEDKFQYLLQSIEPNTRAYDLISSFPPTSSNYDKAVTSLKSRFGKEDLLVEVYVRELLKLVLQNVLDRTSKMSLQYLYDKLESHLRSIDSLGVTTEKCAAILYPLVESCMPEDLLRAWQRSSFRTGDEAKCRLDNLMKFMHTEVEGEQRIGLAMSGFGLENLSLSKSAKRISHNSVKENKFETPSAASLVSTGRPKVSVSLACIFCGKNHKSQDCFEAQRMLLEERRKVLNEKNVCYSCLKPGHSIKNCKANVKCVLCKKNHFLLMCYKLQLKPFKEEKGRSELCEASKSSDENLHKVMLGQSNVLANKSTETNKLGSNVFMQTLLVNVKNPGKRLVKRARVLFDSGSQQSYMTKDLAKAMGYTSVGKQTIVHTLFGNVKSAEQVHNRYVIKLENRNNNCECELEVLDQPVICGSVSQVPPGPWCEELFENQIILTDTETTCLPISILIGADMMGNLLTGNTHHLSCGLVAIETNLGWTLMGKVKNEQSNETNLTKTLITMFVKEADLSDLWNLDSLGIRDPYEHKSKEDQNLTVKVNFLNSTIVNEEGRYEVVLPWIDSHSPLPSNKTMAEKRLSVLLKKLEKDNMYQEYDNVLSQWIEDGIIERVPEDEVNNFGHYLPHRPVIKEGSTTTRIRPVFDASAHEVSQPSINDCLECGPNLIELIPSVMLRFREGKYGVIADIRKAFLQISINPTDRDFLRFIWYKENENKFVVYRHRRVVFGVKCSPFLLAAVIELHLQKVKESTREMSDVVDKLEKSFYVDNVSTSFDAEEDAQRFVESASNIMDKAKFDLRDWVTSKNNDSENNCSTDVNVLGISWNFKDDVLFINMEFLKDMSFQPLTKRKMLSIAHRVFDPIGFSSPVTLCPKLLLQKTWKKQIGWDTEVDEEISEEFFKWYKFLPLLQEIKVRRWIGKTISQTNGYSIHTFCDASKGAYAAVIFLRTDNENKVDVQILSAKTRVAPLKDISIPRIELLAATVGARLTKTVKDTLNWNDIPTYFWTDSTTVLAWIKLKNKWKVFVKNRVNEIKQLSEVSQWNYVPGEKNPADLPSRGCNAKQLIESRWIEGPKWLKNDKSEWPKINLNYNMSEVHEETTSTQSVHNCLTQKEDKVNFKLTEWFTRYFSHYLKIVRLLAWIFRFINNSKLQQSLRSNGELKVIEIESAKMYLFKQIQKETFDGVNDRKIVTLNPLLDENGLIRLETRLCNKKDTYGFRYPIVLPVEHKVVKYLITYYHEENCHAGVQLLMGILRENYWILGGRKSIRSVISKCVKCKRQKVKRLETVIGMLPSDRLRETVAFEVVGTDFAGPIYLKNNQKAWICLYTCAVYRAIHFELVTSLSTDAFLQAFRRFISRRGRPHIVYSDNGTNYVGANNALKGIKWEEIYKYSSARSIEWKFNPPSAAWWGGFWERLVRITKELLRRVLGKACITYEEMNTILCDCESVINSRPLTYLYESEADLIPLTPSHFLHDLKDFGTPDIDRIEEINYNKRQKYLQGLRSNLRKRFRNEYLGELISKTKTNKKYDVVAVGDVILIGSDNKKRIDWPLGLVVEVFPDKKGVTRLVKVKTCNGIFLRPIQKLYPLEISAKETEEINKYKAIKPSQVEERKTPSQVEERKTPSQVEEKKTRSGRSVKLPLRYNLLFE